MDENLHVIRTSRGGKKAIHRGFMYLKYRTGRNLMFWRCVQRCKCPSVITTSGEDEGAEVVLQKAHNHPPDWDSCKAVEVRQRAMEKATTSGESPELIVQNLIEASSSETVAKLPKRESIKRAIRRVRNKELLQESKSLKIQNIFSLNKMIGAQLASAYRLLRLLESEVSSIHSDIENLINGSLITTTTATGTDKKCEDLDRRVGVLAAHYEEYVEQLKMNENLGSLWHTLPSEC